MLNNEEKTDLSFSGIKSAQKLTPLELNGIKLDPKHTLLTPDYLDHLPDSDKK